VDVQRRAAKTERGMRRSHGSRPGVCKSQGLIRCGDSILLQSNHPLAMTPGKVPPLHDQYDERRVSATALRFAVEGTHDLGLGEHRFYM